MNGISNIYFPICAFLISILILIIYFNKKRIDSLETKIYGGLIIINTAESLLACIIILIAALWGTVDVLFLLNRIDYILILMWVWCLFYYVYCMTFGINKKLTLSTLIVNTFVIVALFFTNMTIVNENGVMNSYGVSTNILFVIVGIYILSTLFFIIIGNITKKINANKKYIPLYSLIILAILMMLIRQIKPELVLISFIISYVDFIMYFTIENPDVKVIEQLNLAKDHAEKANRAKSDFLSSMSHEIRTPLNAIVGFSQCILEEDNLDNAKEDAKDIVTASQNLLEIVNGILDISKIEADKMEIVEVNYNPRDNFEKLAKLMIPRIGEKPIELKTKFASDLPATLYGDVSKVKQIVTNILTNAVKYTEKGEINFEVNCVNNDDESKLIISIEDTGRGIKPEKIDKLFNKFERLDEDRNTTTEGTGLGLAITKRLVEMMGGKIVVQSKYGEGSKFTVYLKQKIISLNQEIVDTKIGNVSTDEYPDKKVLVVDDNKINIKVAERLLKDYKVKVESVESGYACLDLIKTGNHYDLILLDDMMPQMSGVETLKELKAIDGYNIPTVALTANAISGMREKYLNDGFDDYLSKPMDKGELHRVLSIYLSSGGRPNLFEPLPPEIYEIEDNNQVLQVEDGEVALDNKGLYQNKMDSSTQSSSVCVEHNQPSEDRFYHNIDYLKQNGIDVDKGLELLDGIELYNETFENFIIETDHRLKELTDYHNQNDMTNYAILAHATKSDAKYLGCDVLAEIAYNHEMESKNDNICYINEHFYDLLSEVKRVVNIGKKYLGKD